MNLNTIQLNPQLLADLYAGSLVESVATTVPEKQAQVYLGNNKQGVLVVVSHTGVPFLPDSELSFLTTVLAACKLSIADIAIINFQRTDNEALLNFIDENARTVLLFGVDPATAGLPINFPQFQLQAFNKRMYLHAPPLNEVEKDKELKKQLWLSLKKMFGL